MVGCLEECKLDLRVVTRMKRKWKYEVDHLPSHLSQGEGVVCWLSRWSKFQEMWNLKKEWLWTTWAVVWQGPCWSWLLTAVDLHMWSLDPFAGLQAQQGPPIKFDIMIIVWNYGRVIIIFDMNFGHLIIFVWILVTSYIFLIWILVTSKLFLICILATS